MNRKDLYFLVVAVGIIALFTVLWMIGRKPPPLTARAEHAGMSRTTPRETCWSCHTPESTSWQRHPKKGKPPDKTTPCSACHKFPEPQVAALFPSTKKGVEFVWSNRQLK